MYNSGFYINLGLDLPLKSGINKMIPKIRKMVSGARIRYEKDGFNLDLTYITDRILAMSFPAAGFQAIYRNHIDTVSMSKN